MRRGRRYSYRRKRIYSPRRRYRVKIVFVLLLLIVMFVASHIAGIDRVKRVVVYNKPSRWDAKCDSLVGLGKYIWNASVDEEELRVKFASMYKIEKLPSFIWYKRYKFVEKRPVGVYKGDLIGFDGSIIRKAQSKDSLYPVIKGKFETDDPVIQSLLYKLPEFSHLFDTVWIDYNVIKGHLSFDKENVYVLFMPSQSSEYVESLTVSTLKTIKNDKRKPRIIDLRFRGQVVLK